MKTSQKRRNFWKSLRRFRANKLAVGGLLLLVVVVAAAILAPWIAPYGAREMHMRNRLEVPQAKFLLGTDNFGRDVLSRIIYSAQTSLLVGVGAAGIGAILGVLLGVLAGVSGGVLGGVIMRGMDTLMTFPALIMGVVVMAVLGPGMLNLILALGVVLTPRFARVAYAPTLIVREKDYVSAATAVGAGKLRIMVRHVIPNILSDILVAGALWVGTAIKIEASLSFVGLGVPPPTPTWGNMIDDGMEYISNAPWICLCAGAAILVTILSLNMLGDGLRDAFDPKLRE